MIRLKSEKDLIYIEHAINVGESILTRISRYIKEGITPEWIDKKIGFLLLLNRSKASFKGYNGFPANSCISVNERIIHCVPDDRLFKEGDIVKVDLGVDYVGYKSDQAKTYIVGNAKSHNHAVLVGATHLALENAILKALPNNTIGDISIAIEEIAKEFNLGILKNWGGHGVGFEVHEEPHIPNIVGKNVDVRLEKGMVLAIEPMFVLGDGNWVKLSDGGIETADKTLSAHFEKTIIIR